LAHTDSSVFYREMVVSCVLLRYIRPCVWTIKRACCHKMAVGSTLNELGYAALLSNEYCQNTATVTLN